MPGETLGRLEKVDLRDVWTSEDSDFTPWLAREENLSVLAETLDLELELEAKEKEVGPFRADILCKDTSSRDTDSNIWVLIENQLEVTDHKHLGQLLTYASGLKAVTIIWIASQFTEQHRSTLDWLNRITDTDFRFFGLEVELWRIGDSPPAPKFNIVSKPNDWSRSVAQATRTMNKTETRIKQLEYWTAFHSVLNEIAGPVHGNRKPRSQSWMPYSIGRTEFSVNSAVNGRERRIRSELWIKGRNAKAFFHLLHEQKDAIQRELGYPLEWEELPKRQNSRIAIYLDDVDPNDEQDWPRQHEWLATRLNKLHQVFSNRVRALDADDWRPVDNADGPPEG